jgi:hypothetical protein
LPQHSLKPNMRLGQKKCRALNMLKMKLQFCCFFKE